ncbi:WW domain containing protein [Parasponia andersonii]|uniref:WW domain containing protein n=1 Tax=Parasponia andersonii TaxID=3476 RepID=A0A2P5BT18_PARAD|nr:WW domain containing protein [Parasponia andersonii]
MAAPNMATITASLEQSFRNCSLNHQTNSAVAGVAGDTASGSIGGSSSSSSSTSETHHHHHLQNEGDTPLELNSHVSLPYHWEQCLDLKTGEIYYINWMNGMKAKEDPRRITEYNNGDHYYSEQDISYDSEESSSDSSPPPPLPPAKDHVLVVGGCKSCFMYFMVPKSVQECPKCCGQLLHFDRSQNGSL